jgi:hypothetical protein
MKIGVIASILEKDATELVNAHKIDAGIETLEGETLENVLKTEIEDLKKSIKINSKKEAFGFAERQVKTDIEKRIKSDFGVDGENIDTLFEALKDKVSKPETKTDEKVLKELEIYKGKYTKTLEEFEGFKKVVESEKRNSVIFSKLETVINENFDVTGRDKLKKIALSDFTGNFDFEILDNEIHLIDKETKKPTFKNLEDVARDYFKEIFPEKSKDLKPPIQPSKYDPAKPQTVGKTKEELVFQLRRERDPAQRELIKKQLNTFN